jgi:ABC-type Fe3+/spermidine/putrescine transport system ATPase subunit
MTTDRSSGIKVTGGSESPVLEVSGISKRFPGVQALDNVDFDVRRGEVHVLLGENGAGKSTLMKILSGAYTSDGGKIVIHGRPVVIRNPRHAQELGISIIYQTFNQAPHLTVDVSSSGHRLDTNKQGSARSPLGTAAARPQTQLGLRDRKSREFAHTRFPDLPNVWQCRSRRASTPRASAATASFQAGPPSATPDRQSASAV